MDRLISETAAIEAVEFGITYAKAIDKETGEVIELFKASNTELKKAIDRIKALPAAQPELVRCRDCRWSPWRSRMYADSAVEIKVCSHSRSPEGFCAWGKEAKKCDD